MATKHKRKQTSDGFRLVEDPLWEKLKIPRSDLGRLDPGLRSVLALLFEGVKDKDKDWYQIEQRGGIRWDPKQTSAEYLPLLVRYDWPKLLRHIPKGIRKQISPSSTGPAMNWLRNDLSLDVSPAYFDAGLPTHSTARIAVRSDDPQRLFRSDKALQDTLAELLALSPALRLELPGGAQPLGVESIEDIGLPARLDSGRGGETPGGETPDGSGVIIGIIDDGCAFAHPNFLVDDGSGPKSRVLYLWDQGWKPKQGATASTPQPLAGFNYGRELTKSMIDTALTNHVSAGVVDEDAVYQDLGYEIADLASHGTHVMDIAAGNGRALATTRGIAPKADIIFVQLPPASVELGGALLDKAVEDGVRYIFARAGSQPAVVNISYGGHLGPHNGEGAVELAIDDMLDGHTNRAVVVAAGNGFAADCHAGGTLPKAGECDLRWIIKPEDPSANTMEIWYDAGAEFQLTLTMPDGTRLDPVSLGTPGRDLESPTGRLLGTIDHQKSDRPSELNRIRITLNPTGSLPPLATTPLVPPGTWTLRLSNVGSIKARWDAWIERDASGGRGSARRMQSHFHPKDAKADRTLGSYATGKLSIAVGGYNTTTRQVCRYSACGPTRDGRHKPEVMAPAEEDAAGRGILSASARSAAPRRMSGTSAAAPQVAGFVALLLQAASTGNALTAKKIRKLVVTGASNARPLRPNGHIDADDRRPRHLKQSTATGKLRPHLTGKGKINWPKTRALLPP